MRGRAIRKCERWRSLGAERVCGAHLWERALERQGLDLAVLVLAPQGTHGASAAAVAVGVAFIGHALAIAASECARS